LQQQRQLVAMEIQTANATPTTHAPLDPQDHQVLKEKMEWMD